MPKAFVLMTAMPPTTGHLQLIQFAEHLADGLGVTVILTTTPDQPMIEERYHSLTLATQWSAVKIKHLDQDLPQDPETPGFRELWQGIMLGFGMRPGDYLVTSETYGKWLAEMVGGIWMPYNIDRDVNPAKASYIREAPYRRFSWMIPEFQRYMQTKVTIFGAESTGKTTLARQLNREAYRKSSIMLPEFARPYLENTSPDINTESMTNIWHGQAAMQRQFMPNRPLIIQDTDLYSTWGYWYQLMKEEIPPVDLLHDARALESDLYLITKSDIPFEPDPLRYGIDHRELDDEYWINMARAQALPFVVLDCAPENRLREARVHIDHALKDKAKLLTYDRQGF